MKLENLNVAKLQLSDLPKFDKCPCELCDDGCFDRAKYEHYPECKRKSVQKTNSNLKRRCPLTHYQSTFQPATHISGGPADHRREPCPPAPDNEIPTSFKNFPMSGITSQREHYPTPPLGSIQKLPSNVSVKVTDSSILRRAVPMETQSHYQVEYVEKPVVPTSYRLLKDSTTDSNIHMNDEREPLSSNTTNRTHYKSWQSSPSKPYAEMPAIAGHVLFPGSSRNFTTSTGTTHVPFPKVSQARPAMRLDNRGNIQLSGSMDLRTNYQDAYISHGSLSARSVPTEKKSQSTEGKVYTRRTMNAISQTSLDFRPYPNHRPPSPAQMEPFVSQINMSNLVKPEDIKSQYRVDYGGIDTRRHTRPPPAAPVDKKPYMAPIQKMDTMTVTQRDFQPIDVTTLPKIRTVPMDAKLSMKDEHGPMENMTMSRFHFQQREPVKSRRQYGDPIPEVYVPPISKFEGTTTTGDTYKGKPGKRAVPYVPEIRSLERVGEHDHRTNYRVDYHSHGLTLCAAKAYAIAQNKEKTLATISAQ